MVILVHTNEEEGENILEHDYGVRISGCCAVSALRYGDRSPPIRSPHTTAERRIWRHAGGVVTSRYAVSDKIAAPFVVIGDSYSVYYPPPAGTTQYARRKSASHGVIGCQLPLNLGLWTPML